jgi:hypothetical protein
LVLQKSSFFKVATEKLNTLSGNYLEKEVEARGKIHRKKNKNREKWVYLLSSTAFTRSPPRPTRAGAAGAAAPGLKKQRASLATKR